MLRKIVPQMCVFVLFAVKIAAIEYSVEDQPQVLERVSQIESTGILKQKSNGYTYLEVSKDFIKKIIPLIESPGKIVAPKFYKFEKGLGAHISVISQDEQVKNDIWEIKELGQEFTFTVTELRSAKVLRNDKMKKVWFLSVASPELERLRENYGLSPRLNDRDFHITIGVQVPGKPSACIEFEEDEDEEA